MNSRLELVGVVSFLVVFFVVLGVLLPYSRNPQASILLAQTIVLAGTLCYVCRYVVAAERTAKAAKEQAEATEEQVKVMKGQFEIMGSQFEVMKEQFDVEYTPHLRPYVYRVYSESVVIALRNLTGTAAIHPGVYPAWSPPRNSADYKVLQKCIEADSLEIVKCATGQVIEVGETWYCRVSLPQEDSGRVEVRHGEDPWGGRKTHVWTLRSMPDMKGAWDFVGEPEE